MDLFWMEDGICLLVCVITILTKDPDEIYAEYWSMPHIWSSRLKAQSSPKFY